MKKRISLILTVVLLITLCGCGQKEDHHNFENGVCTGCKATWTRALYDAGWAKYGKTSTGYTSFYIQVDGGEVYFSVDDRTFFIEYKSDIVDDTRIGYCLRTYIDDSGQVVYSGDGVEYSIHDSNSKPDENAPVSNLNIDFTVDKYFNDTQEYAEYTYLSTYVCPANKLVDAYQTKDVLSGEDPFRLLWNNDYPAYELYTTEDFVQNNASMDAIFGGKSYLTQDEFFDMYLTNYKEYLSQIDAALAQLDLSLADYGIVYK